jgi:hypothetical protein
MTTSIAKKSSTQFATAHCSAPLSESLRHRLNGYALAASAAGVAIFACSNSAEASPTCGSLSVTLSYTDTYAFNPAHQKQPPFNLAHTFADLSSHPQSIQARGFFTPNNPDAEVLASTTGLPAELVSGATIGPGGNFVKGKEYGLLFGYYYHNRFKGNFAPNQTGYVGFKFSESGETHYGWLRLRLANLNGEFYPSLLLSEFGYESTPNTAITAGNCAASASTVVPTPKPQAVASLGLLALGHPGLPIWRRQIQP